MDASNNGDKTLQEQTYIRLFQLATRICKRRGVRISDPDYESAISQGVFMAMSAHREIPEHSDRTPTVRGYRKLSTLACVYALGCCWRVNKRHNRYRRQDEAGACRGTETSYMREHVPIDLNDFEFLSFVAAHGKCRAARLLGMGMDRLNDLLDEVVYRVRHKLRD